MGRDPVGTETGQLFFFFLLEKMERKLRLLFVDERELFKYSTKKITKLLDEFFSPQMAYAIFRALRLMRQWQEPSINPRGGGYLSCDA